MALSDRRIIDEMKKGNVVIEPFRKGHLSTSSYDVSLGEFFYRENNLKHPIFNIWDEKDHAVLWGGVEKAKPAKEVFPTDSTWVGISDDDLVIQIAPGETILAHTEEFIGGRNCITTQMQARSSMGRSFITVCKCAGWGDVGFFNRWTMEITNVSRRHFIPLVVGRRIAQIVFLETGPILEADYAKAGKYQKAGTLEELKASWKPEMMLPRLYKDREITQGRHPVTDVTSL